MAPAIPAVAQDPAPESDTVVHQLEEVRVVVARLKAEGVPIGRLPFAAEVVAARSVRPSDATLADVLDGVTGLSTASQFGSDIQPDVRFRGFQVGPVVGFPQSVSVFVDGVRVNEPDGSQVNFDLIPLHAVERVEVIRSPGGPFGRNTLAGAINVVTRRGSARQGPAGSVELSGGSFGTGEAEGWAAGGLDGWDYLVSGRYLRSDGWRELSRTRIGQLFAKVGYQNERSDVWLSYSFADNYLEGPGSLPRSWLRGRLPADRAGTSDPRRLQFTGFEGDAFSPRLHFAVLGASHRIGVATTLQLRSFARSNRFVQANDNITEPNVRGESDLLSVGSALQLVQSRASGLDWGVGIEYVRNDTDIRIFEEANPAFPSAGGMTESVASVEDNLAAFSHVWWPLSSRLSLTGSLRYDRVDIPVTDRLDPENSGENVFGQLTGSIGGDVLVTSGLRAFASYGRGFRAPVILEISCADPEDPCPLPFELGADPPLEPVTTDTWQGGLRYAPGTVSIELIGYWSEVYDDLFAVVTPPSTRGYFRNLDRTRRQGLELSGHARPGRDLTVDGGLALTRATFQTTATLASALLADDDDDGTGDAGGGGTGAPADDGADDGAVRVQPGDHFAMVPAITARLATEYSPGAWSFRLEGSYVGSQYFVGDEANQEDFGTLPPYFALDGGVRWSLGGFTIFVEGRNLLNSDHNTFGIISPNVLGPREAPQPFLTPALPARAQVGLRYRY